VQLGDTRSARMFSASWPEASSLRARHRLVLHSNGAFMQCQEAQTRLLQGTLAPSRWQSPPALALAGLGL